MNLEKCFIEQSNQINEAYQSGNYHSKSDLARQLGISRNDVTALLKIVSWPLHLKQRVQRMQLPKRKLIQISSMTTDQIEDELSLSNSGVNGYTTKKFQPMKNPTSIPTRFMQVNAGIGTERMQVNAGECNQMHIASTAHKRVQQPLLDQETLQRIKLGLKSVATIILVLMLVGLAAWLTCDLYLGFSANSRPYAAYAVLTVVGVILPVVAHLADGWGKPIAWSLVVLGVFYSSSLVLIGNWQKGTIEQAKSAGKQAQIEALESELVIVKEQHSQWMSGYTDPQNKNYHKAYAAKKTKALTAHIASIQDQITALKVSAGSFSWLMVIVDVLRQAVIELALVLVVHTGISKLLFSQSDRWVEDNDMKMNQNIT